MRVEVYKNLRNGKYSIRSKGKVIDHKDVVAIDNPTFVVQPGGRARVLKEKQKNVHAFVRGELKTSNFSTKGFEKVRYNPYVTGHFQNSNGENVISGSLAILTNSGLWVKNPVIKSWS